MKRTPGYSDEERENYWIEIINQARLHPHGVTAYLESRGVSKNNYYSWFNKLRKSHPEWNDLSKDPALAMKARSKKSGNLPKTEVADKARRRRWSPKEKNRILDEYENALPGKAASVLRREGIYSSQIYEWRRERDEGVLGEKKRGPKPNVAAQEIKRLKAALAKSEKKLAKANALLELQKKVAEILRTSLDENEDDD